MTGNGWAWASVVCVPSALAGAQTPCPPLIGVVEGPTGTGGSAALGVAVAAGVRLTTNEGPIDIDLLLDQAPTTCNNFLSYAQTGRYTGTMFHRSVPLSVQSPIGIIQAGGFRAPTAAVAQWPQGPSFLLPSQRVEPIPTFAPIALEHPLGNVRGAVSMARLSDPGSATSQFFINTVDNNSDAPGRRFSLDAVAGQPGREGYAVFGNVTAGTLAAVDAVRDRARFDLSALSTADGLGEVPLRQPFAEEPQLPLLPSHYERIESVQIRPTPLRQWRGWSPGAGWTFRWNRNGQDLIDGGRYSGTATPDLVIVQAASQDMGSYQCRVEGLPCGQTLNVSVYFSCPADMGVGGGQSGHDGVLDNNDVIAFIGRFFAGDPQADLGVAGGLSGSDGLFDSNDFIAFINHFFSGC